MDFWKDFYLVFCSDGSFITFALHSQFSYALEAGRADRGLCPTTPSYRPNYLNKCV